MSDSHRSRALITIAALAMLAGCNSAPKAPEQQPRITPPQQPQASPAERARLHTELAGGYYERALAPNDSDIHHNWGWYLCEHKREREALEQFEIAVRNSLYRTPEIALVNAGRCAQTIGEIRVAESYFRRALGAQPGNALASYGVALIAYKEARYEEARRWMRAVMQTTTPSPEAIYLGVCIERKLGDRQAELSYTSQLRNRFPDSAETKALTTEACE